MKLTYKNPYLQAPPAPVQAGAGSSSNKDPAKIFSHASSSDCMKIDSPMPVIHVDMGLGVDKLNVIVNMTAEEAYGFASNMSDFWMKNQSILHHEPHYDVYLEKHTNRPVALYRLRPSITWNKGQDKEYTLVSFKHYMEQDDGDVVRIVWSPWKVDLLGQTQQFIDIVAAIMPAENGWGFFMTRGDVRKCDVCFDHHGKKSDYDVDRPYSRTMSPFNGDETTYGGKRESRKSIAVYEKDTQFADVYKAKLSPSPIMRIEARESALTFRLCELVSFKNPLTPIRVYHRAHAEALLKGKYPTLWEEHKLLGTAIRSCVPTKRQQIRNLLIPAQASWWNPAEIWKQWPTVLEQSGLLPCKPLQAPANVPPCAGATEEHTHG